MTATSDSPQQSEPAELVKFHGETDLLAGTLKKFRDENLLEGSSIFSNTTLEVGKTDALIVVDMQNDFLPSRKEYKKKGSLACVEGDLTIDPICEMIDKFKAAGATVCATRDYHPEKHCSFLDEGGWFPPHCVVNTDGVLISEQISETMCKYDDIYIFSKGFLYGFDSFGGFPYKDGSHEGRVCKTKDCSSTGGAVAFKHHTAGEHARSSSAETDEFKDQGCDNSFTLDGYLKEQKIERIFVVGLALEYCVLDTAVNGADHGFQTHILLDCTRAIYNTEKECFDFEPKELADKMKDKVTLRSLLSLKFSDADASREASDPSKRPIAEESSDGTKRQRVGNLETSSSVRILNSESE